MEWVNGIQTTQLTFTCSKGTIETLEKIVKYGQILTIKTLNIFHTFSSVSVGDFEQINVSWGWCN